MNLTFEDYEFLRALELGLCELYQGINYDKAVVFAYSKEFKEIELEIMKSFIKEIIKDIIILNKHQNKEVEFLNPI